MAEVLHMQSALIEDVTPSSQAEPQLAANDEIDWASIDLPDAWPDTQQWWWPSALWLLLRKIRGKQRDRAQLPEHLPGAGKLPRYLLLEFHNLPNGNYSRCITSGYSRGFDHAMLGTMKQARQWIADALHGAGSVLDLGSGAGHLAATLRQSGFNDVWALEPSPYLLSHAARNYPGIRWVQGVGESSGLPDARFDAVGMSFVLHEIPPRYIRELCAELRRVTRPGAKLAIVEPSVLQWRESAWTLFKRYGWRGVYFRALAQRAYEPFIEAWHKLDFAAVLAEHGFVVTHDETGCPFRCIVAERRDPVPS